MPPASDPAPQAAPQSAPPEAASDSVGLHDVRRSIEIERKFDVGEGFSLSQLDLEGLPGVARVGRLVVHQLEAVYADTHDLALLRHRWVLRRRTGGEDAGWHIKRPAGDERSEHHVPLRDSDRHATGASDWAQARFTLPAAVAREVAVHVRGRKVAPVARLATVRRIRALRDAQGRVVAEVMLDEVEAASVGADGQMEPVRRWSEVEIELHGPDEALLEELSRRVQAVGAVPSRSVSKVQQALGPRAVQAREESSAPWPEGRGAAGRAVLGAAIAAEVERLQRHDPGVRVDEHDAVHQMRVAARRLRSLLAAYPGVFDSERSVSLRAELAWLGTELGSSRDVEVIREEVLTLVEAEPRALRRGPLSRRVHTELDRRYRLAHTHAVAVLDTPRYFALLDALDAFAANPWGTVPPTRKKLRRMTRRADRRLRRRHEALAVIDPRAQAGAYEVALHDVRKAAKRARYAAEAMRPLFGDPAARYASAMAAIQSLLGDYQDSVVIRHELLLLAAAARRAEEDAFTYGRLHALQEARAARSLARFGGAWSRGCDPALLLWLGGSAYGVPDDATAE